MTVADTALLVADDHQSGEGEATAALDGGGDAVDGDELFDELRGLLGTVATVAAVFAGTGHSRILRS